MSKKLFVFEGEKTEPNIVEKLSQYLSTTFPKNSFNEDVKCSYCTDIYNLCNKILEDKQDIFVLLQKIEFNKKILKDYNRDDFAEIYLFFDYDGHATNANNKNLLEIIKFFNNETEFGKIFISYPMVEALKHFSKNINFKKLTFEIEKGKEYKKIVSEDSDNKYIQFNKYDKNIWQELIEIHLKKMNFIVNDNFSMPNKIILQNEIFTNQLKKYIKKNNVISVLSAFPVFIFDYYGCNYIDNLIGAKE